MSPLILAAEPDASHVLVQIVQSKAENAGGDVVMVDPRATSQTCLTCGTIKAKTLAERRHRCECGTDLGRDVAAVRIVHQRAFGSDWDIDLRRSSQRIAA